MDTGTLADLTPDPKNLRAHNPRNVGMIVNALGEVGAARSIVVDENGVILAGNATIEAAAEAGIERVRFVDADGEEIIAVRRSGLTDEQKRRLAIFDNRAAELAEWDTEALAAELADGADFTGLFESGELDALLQSLSGSADGADMQSAASDPSSIYPAETVIESAFEHYRAHGFPYRNLATYECMQQINQLAATDSESLMGTTAAYPVADVFQPHRFAVPVDKWNTPLQSFHEDDLLRRALRFTVEHDGRISDATLASTLGIMSHTQAAANFRPGFALRMYRRFCADGATVLDTSTGFGGRLVGFLASRCGLYIGIDPSTETHAGNQRLVDSLSEQDRVELHNLPAEDVPHDAVRGRCDFAFTSPPYFAKERYADESTQSWKRYADGDAWRVGFLHPMMALQYAALKDGCYAAVNIADVKIGSATYPLCDWIREAAEAAGFVFERTEEFPISRAPGEGVKMDAFEPVLLFRKLISLENLVYGDSAVHG